MSDGPTTQCRNKNYFYLLTNHITKIFPKIISVTHNFSEAGHGKGGPDGVGGLLKNLADDAVAHNIDVHSPEAFIEVVTRRVKNVFVMEVKLDETESVSRELLQGLKCFVGTMQAHQLTWNKENKNVYFNFLSCFLCKAGTACSHFSMGEPWKIKDDPVQRKKKLFESQSNNKKSQGIEEVPQSKSKTPVPEKRQRLEKDTAVVTLRRSARLNK